MLSGDRLGDLHLKRELRPAQDGACYPRLAEVGLSRRAVLGAGLALIVVGLPACGGSAEGVPDTGPAHVDDLSGGAPAPSLDGGVGTKTDGTR
jgi:hypothetical protein